MNPFTAEDFFNELSSLPKRLYTHIYEPIIAIGSVVFDQRKKSLPTQNELERAIKTGMTKAAHQNIVFLYGELAKCVNIKKEPMTREKSHKVIGSASVRLAL